jgi:hypothetical protein
MEMGNKEEWKCVCFRHLKGDALIEKQSLESKGKEAKIQRVKGVLGGTAGYNVLVNANTPKL